VSGGSSSGSDDSGKNPANIIGRVYAVSTLLAVIIAVPAVVVAVITHFVFQTDIVVTLAASLIALFISMGFGIRLAKRFVRAPQKEEKDG
jgi:glycerol-3-phosphate acyltransferase PlsY